MLISNTGTGYSPSLNLLDLLILLFNFTVPLNQDIQQFGFQLGLEPFQGFLHNILRIWDTERPTVLGDNCRIQLPVQSWVNFLPFYSDFMLSVQASVDLPLAYSNLVVKKFKCGHDSWRNKGGAALERLLVLFDQLVEKIRIHEILVLFITVGIPIAIVIGRSKSGGSIVRLARLLQTFLVLTLRRLCLTSSATTRSIILQRFFLPLPRFRSFVQLPQRSCCRIALPL
mmetsp:Transcript_27265/g.39031  ORF Transcript_27265/g.39031 Transcript_27265/m.39031 type:complete len:228 (-) Transcript_27265:22-705(-)